MPLENDFTRVFGAIKELEERVKSLEVRSRLDNWNVFVEQEVTPIPTSEWPKTTKPAEHVEDFLKDLPQGHAIAGWQPWEPDYKALFEGEQRERGIDAECRLLTLKSLEQTSSENNQLRFILSILAAVKDDGWIEWHGGECPVGEDAVGYVKFRNGAECGPEGIHRYQWGHYEGLGDIIAYRIAR
jgi:hypothetical protein